MTVYQWLTILGVNTFFTSLIGLIFGLINAKIQAKNTQKIANVKDQAILKTAMRNIIRDMLYKMYVRAEERGFVTFEEQENFIQLYESYTDLGGNSYVHELHDKFLNKPVKEG